MEQKGFKVEDMIDERFKNPPDMTMAEAKECIEFLLASKGQWTAGKPIDDEPEAA
jgi:hypothetical protein